MFKQNIFQKKIAIFNSNSILNSGKKCNHWRKDYRNVGVPPLASIIDWILWGMDLSIDKLCSSSTWLQLSYCYYQINSYHGPFSSISTSKVQLDWGHISRLCYWHYMFLKKSFHTFSTMAGYHHGTPKNDVILTKHPFNGLRSVQHLIAHLCIFIEDVMTAISPIPLPDMQSHIISGFWKFASFLQAVIFIHFIGMAPN